MPLGVAGVDVAPEALPGLDEVVDVGVDDPDGQPALAVEQQHAGDVARGEGSLGRARSRPRVHRPGVARDQREAVAAPRDGVALAALGLTEVGRAPPLRPVVRVQRHEVLGVGAVHVVKDVLRDDPDRPGVLAARATSTTPPRRAAPSRARPPLDRPGPLTPPSPTRSSPAAHTALHSSRSTAARPRRSSPSRLGWPDGRRLYEGPLRPVAGLDMSGLHGRKDHGGPSRARLDGPPW